MIKVDCKKYAQEILDEVKEYCEDHDVGTLSILYAGNNPASASYMKGKLKDAEYCGIPVNQRCFANEADMVDEINNIFALDSLARTFSSTFKQKSCGIIVQLPLPGGFDTKRIQNEIAPSLDVDGFKEESIFSPCTPAGIIHVMKKELGTEDLSGKNVLIIGKGKLVGKPLSEMLLDEGCTVTIAHSRTENLASLLSATRWDCVVSCAGKANLVNMSFVDSELVIDVGTNRDENEKLCGDCFNHEDGDERTKYTSVPGGIGLMTRAMLMRNCVLADR